MTGILMPAENHRISYKFLQLDLSVVIVNYNVKNFLEQCLFSVQKASVGLEVEVCVVDNHSEDESLGFLRPLFPNVRFVENQHNEGFGSANNQVIKDLQGEYVLFLNPDTLVGEECFSQCLDFLRGHEDAGGLGVRMIDGSGRFLPESKRSFPSPAGAFFKVSGIHHLFPSSALFSSYYAVNVKENESGEVDVLSGAFMMIKRTVLYDAGGFDPDYFMYGEDIDLSYRIQKAGYRNYYLGTSTIIHFKGESTQRQTRAHVHHFYTAMSLFVKKHYRGLLALLMKAGIFLSMNFAYLSLALSKTKGSVPNARKRNLFFLGTPEQLADSKSLLENSGSEIAIISSGLKLPESWMPEKVNGVILHEGAVSFSQIIRLTGELPVEMEKLFRASGSHSIVGSGKKGEQGIVIAR